MKSLAWIGSSREDLRACPDQVKDIVGRALLDAQYGGLGRTAKPLHGFGGASVVEIVADDLSGTYRAVYTVRFEEAIYVLHVFQKKARHGIATSRSDIALIKQRLGEANADYQRSKGNPNR